MTVFLMILAIVAILAGGVFLNVGLKSISTKDYGVPLRLTKDMSSASKRLVREFYNLPASSRPDMDIVSIVKALDVKFEVKNVNDHFGRQVRSYGDLGPAYKYQFNWNECYRHSRCSYGAYHQLHDEMVFIGEAIEEQAKALKISSVEGALEDAEMLIGRLREEREILNQVTRELT